MTDAATAIKQEVFPLVELQIASIVIGKTVAINLSSPI
jgi:hypothetical protein